MWGVLTLNPTGYPQCMKRYLCVLLLLPVWSFGQLCQGSLGDPVVNISFGAGDNPGPPLKAASINYLYHTSVCPNDGYYALAHSTAGCFKGDWHTVNADHTGDPNGYFLIINGTYKPGDFYLDTIRSLCANTTYEFAAWMMNMMKGTNDIKPNVTFSIERTDGTILQQYKTGDIPRTATPQWKQYGFYFTTREASDVVLRMTDNAPGGRGNDLALDDITFRPCGPMLNIFIAGTGNARSMQYCSGKDTSFLLESHVSGNDANTLAYQWQQASADGSEWTDIPNAGSPAFSPHITAGTPAGQYQYRLTVAQQANIGSARCRVASNSISISLMASPAAAIRCNSPLCSGTQLNLTGQGGDSYQWSGPDGFTATGSTVTIAGIDLKNAGQYKLKVTAGNGCSSTDSTNVVVVQTPKASAGNDTSICRGSGINLHGSGTGGYTWSPATRLSAANIPNPHANPDTSTRYLLTVQNGQCMDTASLLITVLQRPTAYAGPDKAIQRGEQVQINAQAGGSAISWYWTPDTAISNSQTLQPVFNPAGDATYTLHVTSNAGCGSATDALFIRVYQPLEIPNSFSPNGDHINDTWQITALQTYPTADVSVFNRYGQQVFHSTGYNNPWDGSYNRQVLPVGTYYYIIDLKNNTPKLSGWLLIIK